MLVTAIHKRHNISSFEQGTTRHVSEYDMRYSISISGDNYALPDVFN